MVKGKIKGDCVIDPSAEAGGLRVPSAPGSLRYMPTSMTSPSTGARRTRVMKALRFMGHGTLGCFSSPRPCRLRLNSELGV